MTDDEIIKALKCCMCGNDYYTACMKCPIESTCEDNDTLLAYALDLINRKNAEIEILKADKIIAERHEKDARELYKQAVEQIKTAKSEARKEFAEQFAKKLSEFDMSTVGLPDYDRGYKDCMTAVEDTINNLLEERTEAEE